MFDAGVLVQDRSARLCKAIRDELTNVWMAVSGLPLCYAQTGEEYVVITHAGVKPEGDPSPYHPCHSPEQAAVALAMNIASRFGGCAGTLYWRVEPEIEQRPDGYWQAYARLLVSDAPVQWRTVREVETRGLSHSEMGLSRPFRSALTLEEATPQSRTFTEKAI